MDARLEVELLNATLEIVDAVTGATVDPLLVVQVEITPGAEILVL